jgi:hypothetical protein
LSTYPGNDGRTEGTEQSENVSGHATVATATGRAASCPAAVGAAATVEEDAATTATAAADRTTVTATTGGAAGATEPTGTKSPRRTQKEIKRRAKATRSTWRSTSRKRWTKRS